MILAIVLATMPAADTIPVGAAAAGTVPATAITLRAFPTTYATTPTRVLLVGDSQALTLGIGLEAALTAHPEEVRRPAPAQRGDPRLRRGRRDNG